MATQNIAGLFDDVPSPSEDFCAAAPKFVHVVNGVETTPQEQCTACGELLESDGQYVARYSHNCDNEQQNCAVTKDQIFTDAETAAKVCVLDIQKDMNPGNTQEKIVVTEQT